MAGSDPLSKFAEAHGLAFAPTVELPREGRTLSHDDAKVEGTATGKLPGGIDGTLLHYTYTFTETDADDHTSTVTRHFTLVVTRIPESIGFLPFFGFSGSSSNMSAAAAGSDMKAVDLPDAGSLKNASCYAYKGTSESWLAQLLSPALLDWLARSEDDFGVELANGVFCAGRDSYLNDPAALTALCEDAARIATAIREESVEEVGTGGAEAEAAKDPDAADPRMDAALGEVRIGSPANVLTAGPEFKSYLRRSPYTYWRALRFGLLLTLALNVPAAAIPILLIVGGQYAILAAIELFLIALISFFAFRSRVGSQGSKYAEEAFFRAYAAEREMKLEEPLHFAAAHAEAKLPFKPDRVLAGPLPGGPANGSLVLVGDGTKRSDRIAVVAGPNGPVAEAELQAEAPGISAKLLDSYAERLSKELTAAQAPT
jgi:hypothetical protein